MSRGATGTKPIDDPRVVQDLVVNDLERLPWFYKRYRRRYHGSRSRATCRRRRPLPSRCLPAPPTPCPPISTCRSWRGCSTCRRAWSAPRCGRTRRGCSAPQGPPAAASRSRCTSRCPKAPTLPAGVHWYDPLEHALAQVGPATARRRARTRRHGRPLAYRLALPRAWVPPRVLGRRHHDGPAVGGRRLRGRPRAPVHAVPGRGRRRPGRRGRRARMAGRRGRPRRRYAGDRVERRGCRGRGRRGADGVPARHVGATRGGSRRARRTLGSGCPRGRARRGAHADGGGRARPEGRSVAWTPPAACPSEPFGVPCSWRHEGSTCRTVSWSTTSTDSNRGSTGGPISHSRRDTASCATSSTGSASSRGSGLRRRSS